MSSNPDHRPASVAAIDPYQALGIERTAPEEEIKRAYFRLVRQFPPEREPEQFQRIRAAYELLRDPDQRAQVDLFLLQPPPPLPKRRAPSYDLDVHPHDLIALMVDAATPPMEEDFAALP
jgi:curved DNA-binding protein CbpA